MEGSTERMTFEDTDPNMYIQSLRHGILFEDYLRSKANKYDIRLHQSNIEFQIINVTSNDSGFYWFRHVAPELELTITSKCIVTFYMFPMGFYCISR